MYGEFNDHKRQTFTTHLNMIIRFNVLVIKTEVESKTASSFDGVNGS